MLTLSKIHAVKTKHPQYQPGYYTRDSRQSYEIHTSRQLNGNLIFQEKQEPRPVKQST